MITVYGYNDDLIEVEGDIREEFPYDVPDAESRYLAFSDGTVLDIFYSEAGVWRISPVAYGGRLSIVQAPENDDDNYSDVATIDTAVTWVVYGTDVVAP